MSKIEQGAEALDKLRLKRLMVNDSDLDNYASQVGLDEHTTIRKPNDFMEETIDYFESGGMMQGSALGFPLHQDKAFRFQDRQVTAWSGFNGHGKSMFLNQVLLHFILDENQPCLMISPEMSPKMQLARWVRQFVKKSLPTRDDILRFCDEVDDKLFIYDFENAVGSTRIINAIIYATDKLKAKHIVIDSLMKISDIDSEDYGKQREFLNTLCALAKSQECHIHLVAHSRKAFDEDQPPNKMDVMGSSNLINQCDQLVTVWRNKSKEKVDPDLLSDEDKDKWHKKPDAEVHIQKNRHGDFEGVLKFWFDSPTLTYREKP